MAYREMVFEFINQRLNEADSYEKLVDAGWLIEKYSGWTLTEQDEEILRFNYSLAYSNKAEALYFQSHKN